MSKILAVLDVPDDINDSIHNGLIIGRNWDAKELRKLVKQTEDKKKEITDCIINVYGHGREVSMLTDKIFQLLGVNNGKQ